MIDILLALILDWLLGDPRWLPHPVIYIGKLIGFLEKRVRAFAKSQLGLRLGGGIIVIITAAACFFIPYLLLKLTAPIPWLHHLLNTLLLWTTLAARCLHEEAGKVYKELLKGGLEEARVKLSYIVGRDTKTLTEKEIIRADVETVAENTSDGVIAPLLFGMLGGAPLAMLYKGINTMDSMLGYMNEKYRYIGFFPAKVDDLFNLIPARITGVLIAVASPIAGGNVFRGLKIMIRDRKNHKSPNCAYPEGAAAGALGIQLGGTNSYFGETMYKPTIGDSITELKAHHIMDVIKLMYGAEVLIAAVYLLAVIVFKI